MQIRADHGNKDSTVFLKHQPDDINWNNVGLHIIKKDEYRSVFMKKQPACVTPKIYKSKRPQAFHR